MSACQFLPEFFYQAEVSECLNTTYYPLIFILEDGCRYTDRDPISIGGNDINGLVNDLLSRFYCLPQGALLLAYICPENLPSWSAKCFLLTYARNELGSPVEGCNPPVKINGKHTVCNTVQNNGCLIPYHLGVLSLLGSWSSPLTLVHFGPARNALPVRHLPAIALAQARRAGRLRLRRMPGGLGRRAGTLDHFTKQSILLFALDIAEKGVGGL